MDFYNESGVSESDEAAVYLAESGEIFYTVSADVREYVDVFYNDMSYFLIDNEKEMKEVTIDLNELDKDAWKKLQSWLVEEESVDPEHVKNSVAQVSFTAKGDLLLTDQVGTGYLVQPDTGEIIAQYKETGLARLQEFGDYVMAHSLQGFVIFEKERGQYASGTVIEQEVMAINARLAGSVNLEYSIDIDSEGTCIYITHSEGIIKVGADGSSETVLSRAETSLNDDFAYYHHGMTIIDEEHILMVTKLLEEWTDVIYCYEWVKAEDVIEQEIEVWALKNSLDMQKAVIRFQLKHPEIKVNLTIGMTGENQSIEDAIRKANTEFLAGKGADVILMDHMPLDSYIEKGMLEDLAFIYDDLQSDNMLFANIAETYKKNEGIYAIPSRFVFMTITGDEKIVNPEKRCGWFIHQILSI